MKLEGYTPEIFLENFLNDCMVFGEDTTQAIYEEIFSAITGKKVRLGNFVEELEESMNEFLNENEDILTETPADDRMVQEYVAQAVNKYYLSKNPVALKNAISMASAPNGAAAAQGQAALGTIINGSKEEAAKAVANVGSQLAAAQAPHPAGPGILAKVGNFISTLPGKVKAFFGSLQGKSFGEIMKQGMGWLQANPLLALKTTGGIALIALLIRALKKRGELNRYKALAAIEARANTLKEDCYDTLFEDSKEKEAMRKVLEECKTNKALAKIILD